MGHSIVYWLPARLPASTTDITADGFLFFLDRFVYVMDSDLSAGSSEIGLCFRLGRKSK